MSNHITIELCAADQARIDKLIDRLEAVANLTAALIDKNTPPTVTQAPITVPDELTEKLKAIVESAKYVTEEVEVTTPPTNPTIEETPAEAEEPQPTKAISRAELGAKVREVMTKGFKEETKAIVREYATTVQGIPEDKVTECYDRLVALEG